MEIQKGDPKKDYEAIGKEVVVAEQDGDPLIVNEENK